MNGFQGFLCGIACALVPTAVVMAWLFSAATVGWRRRR